MLAILKSSSIIRDNVGIFGRFVATEAQRIVVRNCINPSANVQGSPYLSRGGVHLPFPTRCRIAKPGRSPGFRFAGRYRRLPRNDTRSILPPSTLLSTSPDDLFAAGTKVVPSGSASRGGAFSEESISNHEGASSS